MNPIKQIAIVAVASICAAMAGAAEADGPAGPAAILADLTAAFPDSNARPLPDSDVLPGAYEMRGLGNSRRTFLFPDHTYASLLYFDIGTIYEEGNWKFERGVTTLQPIAPFEGGEQRKPTQLAPFRFRLDGKDTVLLVQMDTWALGRASLLGEVRPAAPLALNWLKGSYALVKAGDLEAAEVDEIKEKLEEDHGRFSFNGITARFGVVFSQAERQVDGSWRFTGAGSGSGFLLRNAPPGSPATKITTGGNAEGLAEITIRNVKLRARQIDVSARLGAVALAGSVEIVGGKLPESSGIDIIVDGKLPVAREVDERTANRIADLVNGGIAKARSGNIAGAIADFDRALPLDPFDADIYLNRGVAKSSNEDLDGALADLNRAIGLNPKLADAYLNRGMVHGMKGALDLAMADLNRSLDLGPDDPSALTNRSYAKYLKGDMDGAIADASRAIEIDPRIFEAYTNRGIARKEKGDFDGAIADYDRALALNPRDPETRENRAEAVRLRDVSRGPR